MIPDNNLCVIFRNNHVCMLLLEPCLAFAHDKYCFSFDSSPLFTNTPRHECSIPWSPIQASLDRNPMSGRVWMTWIKACLSFSIATSSRRRCWGILLRHPARPQQRLKPVQISSKRRDSGGRIRGSCIKCNNANSYAIALSLQQQEHDKTSERRSNRSRPVSQVITPPTLRQSPIDPTRVVSVSAGGSEAVQAGSNQKKKRQSCLMM